MQTTYVDSTLSNAGKRGYVLNELVRMDGWSPAAVAGAVAASDEERSSSEGEYTVRNSPLKDSEKREDGARMAVGASPGFGFSGLDTLSTLRLHRTGQAAEKNLRYLHSLWTPGALLQTDPGTTSRSGKMTSSRARRLGRLRRSMGPIGKDIYGKTFNKVACMLAW